MWRCRPATAAAAAARTRQAAGPSRTRGPAQSACGARPPLSSQAVVARGARSTQRQQSHPTAAEPPDGSRAAHRTTCLRAQSFQQLQIGRRRSLLHLTGAGAHGNVALGADGQDARHKLCVGSSPAHFDLRTNQGSPVRKPRSRPLATVTPSRDSLHLARNAPGQRNGMQHVHVWRTTACRMETFGELGTAPERRPRRRQRRAGAPGCGGRPSARW